MSADTEQKGAHTPLVVRPTEPFGYVEPDAAPFELMFDDSIQFVVAAVIGDVDGLDAKANADRLALCWNSHDDLLAALRELLKMVEAAHRQLGMWADDNKRIVQARAALAKATQ